MTIPVWAIPTALSILVVLLGVFWPTPSSRGDYDFTGAFVAMFQLAAVIIVLLLIWLIYFAAR